MSSNILVVCKPSGLAERTHKANSRHDISIKKVKDVLLNLKKRKSFNYKIIFSIEKDIASAEINEYDIIVTLGGDGTLLNTSHYISKTPILAINSAPGYSEGFFCGCNADNFVEIAEELLIHKMGTQKEVARMRVSVITKEGITKLVSNRGLNDALYCHTNPALTTRYSVLFDGKEESQMSSGIWFSTAVGSTAAIRSAGGFTMPHDNSNIQYLIREPYQPRNNRYQLIHGFLRPKEQIQILSKINDGQVNVDGAHIKHPVREEDMLVIEKSNEPLTLLNFRNN